MTGLLGFGGGTSVDWPVVNMNYNYNSDGVQPPDYRFTFPETNEGMSQEVDVLWTRSYMPGYINQANPGANVIDDMPQLWEYNICVTGVHVRKLVAGVVLDSNGNPVSGATVQLYNTSTGLLVDTQTSMADGSYKTGDPNNVSSFAIAYLTGSPDTAGTTANTLTGT